MQLKNWAKGEDGFQGLWKMVPIKNHSTVWVGTAKCCTQGDSMNQKKQLFTWIEAQVWVIYILKQPESSQKMLNPKIILN